MPSAACAAEEPASAALVGGGSAGGAGDANFGQFYPGSGAADSMVHNQPLTLTPTPTLTQTSSPTPTPTLTPTLTLNQVHNTINVPMAPMWRRKGHEAATKASSGRAGGAAPPLVYY